MGSRNVRIVVLCEDKQQFTFAYRCLKRLGFRPRDIEAKFTGLGRAGGAGEKYVRDQYAAEVEQVRRRHALSALLTVIDADTTTVSLRERQLSQALAGAQQQRAASEPIAHWIPRRNIETWIHFLLGQAVNEQLPYPKFNGRERDCEPAAKRLALIIRAREPSPTGSLPSLLHGIAETSRLL